MKGQYHNPKAGKLATVQVEAVSDYNLYCWKVYSSRPGTNNDLTVLDSSTLVTSILNGTRKMKLSQGYKNDGEVKNWYLYYLTDGIYTNWSIFVKPYQSPKNMKELAMSRAQEGQRKEVERLFGTLQGRFRILRHEFHEWRDESLIEILETCLILHNMLVQFRLNGMLENEADEFGDPISAIQVIQELTDGINEGTNSDQSSNKSNNEDANNGEGNVQWLQELLSTEEAIRNSHSHFALRSRLSNHIRQSIGMEF